MKEDKYIDPQWTEDELEIYKFENGLKPGDLLQSTRDIDCGCYVFGNTTERIMQINKNDILMFVKYDKKLHFVRAVYKTTLYEFYPMFIGKWFEKI